MMRKLLSVLAVAFLAVGVASTANASALAYDGTLNLELGTLPAIQTTGSGVVTVNGSGGGDHLTTLTYQSGVTATQTVIVPITDPVAGMTVVSLRATAITVGAGTLSPISGGGALTSNIMPVQGTVLVCILMKGCGSNLPVPLTVNGTAGVGIGGAAITISGYSQGGLRLSVTGNPWTIGTAAVTGIPTANGGFSTSTRKGFAHGPASNTSSTAQPSGVVQLVTPVIVNTTISGSETLALFGTLTLHFIPEPGTMLLLGSGVAGLALLGRRRMRK
jgi:hypothetical protein